MGLADKFKIPVKCAKCGNEIPKSLRELHVGDVVTCACGAEITIAGDDPKELTGALDRFDNAFQRIKNACKKRW